METIPVTAGANLVVPSGRNSILVGAPPEALKVTLLWEWPVPATVVLPADPLYAFGVNQASFEFLLFNHLFYAGGLRDKIPFQVVCDPSQYARAWQLARGFLRGPTDAEMAEFDTPSYHRQQLTREMDFVSRPVSQTPVEDMVRVVPFEDGRAKLLDGTIIENVPEGQCTIVAGGERVVVRRQPDGRGRLPFLFPEPAEPVAGPQFGLQVIGSASGFSAADWSSCFLVWINGQPLVVDGTPYLDEHLETLGIDEEMILGYLITHNHEDHANAIGQLVNHRQVTVLTSAPVMAGLVIRLSAILDRPTSEVRRLINWVLLEPGLEAPGEPKHWYGAEITCWYSIHTLPTLGVDVSLGGQRIRLPGDTLWGKQLDPLLESGVISKKRYQFIQDSYGDADLVVADAGGGPIHPDPDEVRKWMEANVNQRMLVTHMPETSRNVLPNAEPGELVTLQPPLERSARDVRALMSSPLLRNASERWLTALLGAGEVRPLERNQTLKGSEPFVVLSGAVAVERDGDRILRLDRGDVYHPALLPDAESFAVRADSTWTRLLIVPERTFVEFLRDAKLERVLRQLYSTRRWWQQLTEADLPLDTLLALSRRGRPRRFKAGEAIIRQGDQATHLYLLTEGEVAIELENGSGSHTLETQGPGFAFGVVSLLEGSPRQATVRGVTDVRVLALPADAFRRHLLDIPLARYALGRARDQRVARLRAGEGALTGIARLSPTGRA